MSQRSSRNWETMSDNRFTCAVVKPQSYEPNENNSFHSAPSLINWHDEYDGKLEWNFELKVFTGCEPSTELKEPWGWDTDVDPYMRHYTSAISTCWVSWQIKLCLCSLLSTFSEPARLPKLQNHRWDVVMYSLSPACGYRRTAVAIGREAELEDAFHCWAKMYWLFLDELPAKCPPPFLYLISFCTVHNLKDYGYFPTGRRSLPRLNYHICQEGLKLFTVYIVMLQPRSSGFPGQAANGELICGCGVSRGDCMDW